MIRLNLGSGPHRSDGWTAIDASWNAWLAQRPLARRAARALGLLAPEHDAVGWPPSGILCHDVRRGLPFTGASVDAIFAAHFLEHLTPAEAAALLTECRRVLKPGAAIRIVVPDLEWMAGAYARSLQSPDDEVRARACERFLAALNLEGFRAWPRGAAWVLARHLGRTGHRALYDRHALCAALARAGFVGPGCRPRGDSRIPGIEAVERPEQFVASVCVEATCPPLDQSL